MSGTQHFHCGCVLDENDDAIVLCPPHQKILEAYHAAEPDEQETFFTRLQQGSAEEPPE